MARTKRTAAVTPPPAPYETPTVMFFRPETYWGTIDSMVATIKGEMRRRRVMDLLAADRPEEIDEVLLGPSMHPEASRFLRAIGPALVLGEGLLDFEPGEVEIARVVIAYGRQSVASVRAQRYKERIAIRVVGEGTGALSIPLHSSITLRPLSLEDVIDVLDDIRGVPAPATRPGIVHEALATLLDEEASAEGAASAVLADSAFYPALGGMYAARLTTWCTWQVELRRAVECGLGPEEMPPMPESLEYRPRPRPNADPERPRSTLAPKPAAGAK